MLAVAAVLAVVGGIVVAVSASSKHEGLTGGSSSLPAASLHVAHRHHGGVAYGKPLRLRLANGALSAVSVSDRGGAMVTGTFNRTRTRWHSTKPLAPSSRLKATISYVDLNHHTAHRTMSLHTAAAPHTYHAYLSPGGGKVGVGSPVIVTFDRAIPASRRAAVESGLSVATHPHVVGAWHWMSDTVVHWRPPTYWKPGTKVTLSSDLQGVSIGHGYWGTVGRHSTHFSIGPSHISEVDQASHEMKVFDNGRLIRTFPVSTGRSQYPTMDGVHIALEKSQSVDMDSATVGIPKGSPGYYNEIVYWDVRISNGGEFVHAAPWSVGEQGHINVSHGCVNLSTENAEWFYDWSLPGDVVDVYGGVRPPEAGDAGTADWNMSWKQWVAGDAAPTAAAKHAHPRAARTYEPGFTPAAKKKSAKHDGHSSKHSTSKHSTSKHSTSSKHSKKGSGSGSSSW